MKLLQEILTQRVKVLKRLLLNGLKEFYLGSDGHFGCVLQRLTDGQPRDQVTLLGHVAAAFLEQPHGHWDTVQEDLTPGGTLGTTGNHLQKRPLSTS